MTNTQEASWFPLGLTRKTLDKFKRENTLTGGDKNVSELLLTLAKQAGLLFILALAESPLSPIFYLELAVELPHILDMKLRKTQT